MNRPALSVALAFALAAAATTAPARAQSFCEPVPAETLVAPTLLGNGSPGSVSTAQIQAALDAGGPIRFNVGASPTTIVVTQTLVASRETVLDGAGVVTLSGGNARRILEIQTPAASIYRLTLQNIALVSGTTAGAPITGRGGAIFKTGGDIPHRVSLKLVNCLFENNNAPLDAQSQDDGGGALYATLMNRIDVGNCVFRNNSGSNGGALYSLGSLRLNVVDSRFELNDAIGTGGNPGNGGNAGALGVDGATRLVDVCRTQFVTNTSNAYGAGFFSVMYDAQSRSRFEDVVFQGNVQNGANEHTGGAYIQDGPWALERVAFIGNDARGFGGLFVAGNAPGTIRNGVFSNNVARTGLGAAMALSNSAPISIVNTTIANNVSTAAFAAGIAIGTPNQLRLTNVLFANNTGGNVFVNWAMNNPAAFDGGGNMQWPQVRPMNGGSETPVTASSVFANPLLPGSAADNGGRIPTLALAAGSPARNGGVNTAEVPPTDARGAGRVGGVDRGSYEFDPNDLVFANGFEGDGGN